VVVVVVVVVVVEKVSGSIVNPNDRYTFLVPLYLLALLNSAKGTRPSLLLATWFMRPFTSMFSRSLDFKIWCILHASAGQ
jgi:hypothetical protein